MSPGKSSASDEVLAFPRVAKRETFRSSFARPQRGHLGRVVVLTRREKKLKIVWQSPQ
jgi:hypothetical protein